MIWLNGITHSTKMQVGNMYNRRNEMFLSNVIQSKRPMSAQIYLSHFLYVFIILGNALVSNRNHKYGAFCIFWLNVRVRNHLLKSSINEWFLRNNFHRITDLIAYMMCIIAGWMYDISYIFVMVFLSTAMAQNRHITKTVYTHGFIVFAGMW